jgi:hypothetical protein
MAPHSKADAQIVEKIFLIAVSRIGNRARRVPLGALERKRAKQPGFPAAAKNEAPKSDRTKGPLAW